MLKHKERLQENYEACSEPEFTSRMIQEIKRRWVQVLRVHVSGDFFARDYVDQWIAIAKACRKVKLYAYTRSWRIEAIVPALCEFAALKNVRLWYSADREAMPELPLPPRVRIAYLQVDEEEPPEEAHLLFKVKKLRKTKAVGLPMVCPSDSHTGKAKGVDCGVCAHCWR
jgi:hypothetical protein